MKKIKKTMAYLFALTCCFAAATTFSGNYIKNSVVAHAEEEQEEKTYGNYSYVVYDKIEGVCDTPCIEITKYTNGIYWYMTIPSEIDGLPVVSLAKDALKGSSMFNIYLPSSIKNFGEGFVESLPRAGTVTIDNKFKFSMNYVSNPMSSDVNDLILKSFSLTAIYPPENKEIIEDLEIPETVCGFPVTKIEYETFSGNKNIRSVKIPDTVSYFGSRLFQNSSLQSVNIPKSLKVLPSDVFKGCTNLKSVDFHENVIVANNAFKDTNFKVPDNVKVSENDKLYVSDSYSGITKKSGDFDIKISYDNTANEYFGEILSYNPNALSGTTADVVIPDYFCEIPIKEINNHFWTECNEAGIDLCSIVFPSEMTNIKNLNLNNPEALQSVTIKGKNIEIQDDAFKSTGIEDIVLNGACTINQMAFMDCKNLKKVEFTGDSPTININHDAFRNCTSIEEIIFPENMTADFKIDAFRNCSAVNELTFNGNINITSHAFRECSGLKNLTFNGDINLSTDAFYNCNHITNIAIDTSKPINGSAFNGCVNLLNINSSPVYNPAEKNFHTEINDFVFNNFNGANDVGFINLYVLEQVDNVIEKYITADMTDMQKIKTLHDWVCNNIVYDNEDVYSPKNHNDASIFMNDSSVCEGYAKCYNLLLNRAGIETYYLIGKNHAWNIIKLGGHYFHSDTTWDDGDNISYDWFLKSDSETTAETANHVTWTLNTPSALHNFQKSPLPECKYSMGDLNTDGETNISDLVILNKYLNGQSTVSADDIVLADLTYDGVTDVFDLVLMRKLVLNK